MTSFPEAEKRTEVALAPPGIWRRFGSTTASSVRRRLFVLGDGVVSRSRFPGLGHRGRVSFNSGTVSSLFQRRQQQHTACLYRVPTADTHTHHQAWRSRDLRYLETLFLADRTATRNKVGYWHDIDFCLSVWRLWQRLLWLNDTSNSKSVWTTECEVPSAIRTLFYDFQAILK